MKVKLGSLHCCYAAGVAYRERPRETWSVMRCVYLPRDKFDVFGETDAVWCMFAYCYFRLRRCTPDAGNNSRLSISATNYYVFPKNTMYSGSLLVHTDTVKGQDQRQSVC